MVIRRVRTMWRDFDIEKYAPPRQSLKEQPSSATESYLSNKENSFSASKNKVGETWSPMITIPKPFKMTLRESNKSKKKTKVFMSGLMEV